MGIIPQKAPTATTEIKRPYEAAKIRSLPLDEQGRLRKESETTPNRHCSRCCSSYFRRY